MIFKKIKGQQEMVGFAIILVLVFVILLVVLSSSIRNSDNDLVESYEVSGFIQSFLQYTTGCEDNREKLDVQKLMFECSLNAKCVDGRETCDVLETTINGILDESWNYGEDYPVKGYELLMISNSKELLNISRGEKTNNFKGSNQDFSRSGSNLGVFFTAYY